MGFIDLLAMLAQFLDMTGRPFKMEVSVIFNTSRNRWIVDVPPSISGKRERKSFKSHSDALIYAGKVSQGIESGLLIASPITSSSSVPISKMVAAFLSNIDLMVEANETSKDNATTLHWGLKRFAFQFGHMAPEKLTPVLIEAWLKSSKYKTRGKFNLFAAGRTLYNWSVLREVCPLNPFRDAPPKKDKNHRLPILTPDEMKTLLAAPLKPFFKAWIVAGAFSGLRSCEYERITYENIDYAHKEIVIREEESKQGNASRPRDIPIYPAFERNMPKGTGPLDAGVSWKKMQDEMAIALNSLGWKAWKKNCLRHSFASYALAQSRDPSKTAYEMGHESPKLLFSTYANKVSRSDSAAWWDL
jgi:integrase